MSGASEGSTVQGVVRVRVRYCECDPMNVAHHASYVPWFELARTELLRERGMSYARLEHEGVLLMVTRLEVSFRSPVLYDDVIEITTTVKHTGRVRLRHAYAVRVVERMGEPVAAGPWRCPLPSEDDRPEHEQCGPGGRDAANLSNGRAASGLVIGLAGTNRATGHDRPDSPVRVGAQSRGCRCD